MCSSGAAASAQSGDHGCSEHFDAWFVSTYWQSLVRMFLGSFYRSCEKRLAFGSLAMQSVREQDADVCARLPGRRYQVSLAEVSGSWFVGS